jgi:rSAM/selenodomain-associated transferase 2
VTPELSIIIPVFNEIDFINPALGSLSKLPYKEHVEVIVSDGSPGGDTIRAVEPLFTRHLLIKTISSSKGRGLQMNQGARVSKGRILLFLHVDTFLPPDAYQSILRLTKDHGIVGGAFDLGIRSVAKKYRLIERVASLRSRLTRLPYGDQAIFVRKDIFCKVGGFGNIPLMEDVDLMQRIKKNGYRIKILPLKVQTSPRRWDKEGPLYSTLRNWILISLYMCGVAPEKLVKYYPYP